jgi:uncharacterized membrane protein YbhN (UPF0104 family)
MVKKYLKIALKIVLSALAIYLITQKVDIDKAWGYLSETNWVFLVLALLAFLTSKTFSAFRINRLYKSQGILIPNVLNVKVYLLGMFYNLFIPLIGGEGYKVIYLRKRFDASGKRLAVAALLDRVSGMIALATLTVIFFMFSTFELPFKSWFLLGIPLFYLTHWFGIKLFFKSFLPKFWSTSLYSVGVQAFQVVCAFCVIMSLGVDESIAEYLFVFLLASFAFVLPMIGAREMAFVFGAEYLGLNMEVSLAIGLLFIYLWPFPL